MKKIVLSLFVLSSFMAQPRVTKVRFVESEREADVVISYVLTEREAHYKVALVKRDMSITPQGYKVWKVVENNHEKVDLKVFVTDESYRRDVVKILQEEMF